jgi:O-antigen/teichoic acid export membrane protein
MKMDNYKSDYREVIVHYGEDIFTTISTILYGYLLGRLMSESIFGEMNIFFTFGMMVVFLWIRLRMN